MSKQSYEMIEGQAGEGTATACGSVSSLGRAPASSAAEGEGGALLSGTVTSQRKGRVVACVAALLAVGLLLSCVSASPSVTAGSAADAAPAAMTPMQASTDSIPACCLMSCTSSGCDWDSAPFLCQEGGSTGGCADKAATWAGGDSCTSFCDLSGCADTVAKAGSGDGEELPRRCPGCDERQCSRLAEQWSQACGKAAPFVCLSGAATWGCADSELAWASAPATTCGECCDVGAC